MRLSAATKRPTETLVNACSIDPVILPPMDFNTTATAFIGELRQRNRAYVEAQVTIPADVPCGDCHACCSITHDIEYNKRDDTSLFIDGILPKVDTRCAYLTKTGCSAYQRRPAMCRLYDCRVIALTGLVPEGPPEIVKAITRWDINTAVKSSADAMILVRIIRRRDIMLQGNDEPAELYEFCQKVLLTCD